MLVEVPPGVTAVSVQQQEFTPDRFGIITMPDSLGEYLLGLGVGFEQATERPPPGSPARLTRWGAPPMGGTAVAAPRSGSTLTVADLKLPSAGLQRACLSGARAGDPIKGRRQG